MRRLAVALTAALALGAGLTACGERDPVAGTGTGETREITHAMGTTSGAPVTGQGTTTQSSPKTSRTRSAVRISRGGPAATTAPARIATRWSA